MRDDWEVVYDPMQDRGTITYKGSKDERGAYPVSVELQFQHGPIGDNGVNGVQNEELISLLMMRIDQLDLRMPCDENKEAHLGLNMALVALHGRTQKRLAQGVEGTERPHSDTETRTCSSTITCEQTFGHEDAHTNGGFMWTGE